MRTSIQHSPVLIKGRKRRILVARHTYPGGPNNGQPRVLVNVVGKREGYATKAEANKDAKILRQMVRDGATPFELVAEFPNWTPTPDDTEGGEA